VRLCCLQSCVRLTQPDQCTVGYGTGFIQHHNSRHHNCIIPHPQPPSDCATTVTLRFSRVGPLHVPTAYDVAQHDDYYVAPLGSGQAAGSETNNAFPSPAATRRSMLCDIRRRAPLIQPRRSSHVAFSSHVLAPPWRVIVVLIGAYCGLAKTETDLS
jgi:hypothetical protein